MTKLADLIRKGMSLKEANALINQLSIEPEDEALELDDECEDDEGDDATD